MYYGTLLSYIHDLLAVCSAVIVIFCTFSHNYGYSWFQTAAVAKATATVTVTIGHVSRNIRISWFATTGYRLTEPRQHYRLPI